MEIRLLAGSEGHDPALVLSCTRGVLADNTLCSLATVDAADNSAYIWTAYYCFSEDLRLFVLTSPQTHHARHLQARPSAAVAIYDSTQPWGSPKRGLQLLGSAAITQGGETARALALYLRRYPAAARLARHPFDLTRTDAGFYVVAVDRIRLFDEPTFGEEVLIDLEVVR